LKRWYPANLAGHTTSVGAGPYGLAFDGANMWVANVNAGSVTEISANNGAVLGTFSVGATSPIKIVYDGFYVWTANNFETFVVSF
jgi:DNA-binding beta-propeller fold protein YncE